VENEMIGIATQQLPGGARHTQRQRSAIQDAVESTAAAPSAGSFCAGILAAFDTPRHRSMRGLTTHWHGKVGAPAGTAPRALVEALPTTGSAGVSPANTGAPSCGRDARAPGLVLLVEVANSTVLYQLRQGGGLAKLKARLAELSHGKVVDVRLVPAGRT